MSALPAPQEVAGRADLFLKRSPPSTFAKAQPLIYTENTTQRSAKVTTEQVPSMIFLFERPLPPAWTYPCSLEDIQQRLRILPEQDLDGLWAIGLAPSTQKDQSANGRYFRDSKPTILLYSYPEKLEYKMPPFVKQKHIEHDLKVELKYGMQIEQTGSRWLCKWTQENLCRYTIDHVLLHEIGHHVHHEQRAKQGLEYLPRTQASEQFAEDYALRNALYLRGT
jgi:hypothetical protein